MLKTAILCTLLCVGITTMQAANTTLQLNATLGIGTVTGQLVFNGNTFVSANISAPGTGTGPYVGLALRACSNFDCTSGSTALLLSDATDTYRLFLNFPTPTPGSLIGFTGGPITPDSTSLFSGINNIRTNQLLTRIVSGSLQPGALRFVPVAPCRLMETRPEYNFQGRTGAFGPPFLNRGETRALNLPQSTVCPGLASAKANVLNVTVIPRAGGAVDFVTVYPALETPPSFYTVRSPDGQTVANSAIVKAGASGGISVYASDNTDMIIDISGFFTDDTSVTGYAYYPLTPCRVLDTRALYRPAAGPFGPPALNAGERRSFVFPQATQYCQVPAGATAYSVTITVAPPAPLAFLTAWPTGGAQPNVSSLNAPSGRTLANSVIVPASSSGSIDAFVFDKSDALMDITGYFAPDNGQGFLYFPVTQCRAGDTQFTDAQAKTISVACVGIPATASGYAANVTSISGGSPMPFLTLYPTGQARPNASTLNAFEGQTITNSTIVPSGTNASIDVFAYRHTEVVLEVSGYFGR